MRIFRPWKQYRSLSDIDPGSLLAEGIRFYIFDFDNTLAAHKSDKITEEAASLILKLQLLSLDYCVLSNAKKKRLEPVLADNLLKGRGMAMKPLPFSLIAMMKKHGYKKNQTLISGDQLFTDVLAGKFAGVRTALVERINDSEDASIRFKRKLEKFLLKKGEKGD